VLQPLLDADGNPVLDANDNPEMVPVTTSLALDATQQAMITQLYTASQSASLGDQGLSLAGPGTFNITANSIDLGVSGGIRVLAPDAGLAAISPYGANINVTTLGDLDDDEHENCQRKLSRQSISMSAARWMSADSSPRLVTQRAEGNFHHERRKCFRHRQRRRECGWLAHRRLRRRRHQCEIAQRRRERRRGRRGLRER
jgi:hypothetical protein